jgi:hypothetical protein
MINQNEAGNLQLMSAREFFKEVNIIIDEDENGAFIVLKSKREPGLKVKIPIKKETLDYTVPEFLKANGFKHIRIDKFFYDNDLLIESSALVFGLVIIIEIKYKNSDNEGAFILFVPGYSAVASIVERQKSKNILKIKYINCFWNGKELSEEIISEKIYAIEGEDYVKNIEEIKDMLIA